MNLFPSVPARPSPGRYPEIDDQRPLELRLRNGRRLSLCGSVRASLNEIFLHKIYDVPGVAWRQCRQVFDLGAGAGVFSVYVAGQAPFACVSAFETSADFPLLQRNVAANIDGGRAYRMAVSVSRGQRRLALRRGARDYWPADGGYRFETVPCVTLEDAFALSGASLCDFLKIDVCGDDKAILLETPLDVLRLVRVMAVKWSCTEEDLPPVRLRLAAAGFVTNAEYVGPARTQIMLKAWRA